MTAFLFIPATAGSGNRRVDFAKMAGLFAETEEPARGAARKPTRLLRVAATALLLLLAIGDTCLLAKPGSLICEAAPHPASAKATL